MSGYMSSISFGGLASGMDTQALIAQLVALNRRPISLVEQQISRYQQKRDLLGQLKSKLETLQEKVEVLQEMDTFLSHTISLNKDDILSASAGSGATEGTYRIDVTTLAKAESWASQGYAGAKTTTVGTGTLKITVGGVETNITIAEGQDTLAEVASAINNSDAEVTATILNDGSDQPYKLVITANESGTENSITIDASGLQGGDTPLDFSDSPVQAAADASITVNGVTITRSGNAVDDAVPGVTLQLLNTGNGVELTVSPNEEEMKEKIEDFVNAYNTVMSFIHGQSQYNPDASSERPLRGDYSLRIIQRSLQSIISGQVNNPNTLFSNLSQIGLSTNSNGTLEIDDETLEEAISDNMASVAHLFMDGGVADDLYDRIEGLIDTYEGLIPTRQEGIDDILKNLNDRVDRMEYRLSQYEQSLVRKFSALEGLMARLQSMSSYFLENRSSY